MGWSGSATVGVCYRTGCNVVSLRCNVVSLRCNAHFGAQVYDCGVVDDQSVCAPHQLLGQQGACRVSHSVEGTQQCCRRLRSRLAHADYSRRPLFCFAFAVAPLRLAPLRSHSRRGQTLRILSTAVKPVDRLSAAVAATLSLHSSIHLGSGAPSHSPQRVTRRLVSRLTGMCRTSRQRRTTSGTSGHCTPCGVLSRRWALTTRSGLGSSTVSVPCQSCRCSAVYL